MDVAASMTPSGRDASGKGHGSPDLGTGPWVSTADWFTEAEAALWLPISLVTSGDFAAGRPRARIS